MIEFTISQEDMARIAEKLTQIATNLQGKVLYEGLRDSALHVESRLKENISGSILKVRSGRLRSSIASIVISEDKGLKAIIGSGVRQGNRLPYANIHETGGTITPRLARWLTIPLDAAKTAAGVQRFTAKDVMAGATKYSGSFVRKGIIFGKLERGKSARIIPLFVLKQSVNIPPRYYMSKTLEQMAHNITRIILTRIDEELKK